MEATSYPHARTDAPAKPSTPRRPEPRTSELPVFASESDRRARAIGMAGRVIAVVTAFWLIALAVGAFGLHPLPGLEVPGAGGASPDRVGSQQGPSPLTDRSSRASTEHGADPDRSAARRAAARRAAARRSASGDTNRRAPGTASGGGSASGGGAASSAPAPEATPSSTGNGGGASATAPGASHRPPPASTTDAPGRSESAPGHTEAGSRGQGGGQGRGKGARAP